MLRTSLSKKILEFIYFRLSFLYLPKSRRLEGIRNSIIENVPISMIIDGGANSGQWTKELLRSFPNKPIHSLEPLSEPYNKLKESLRKYPNVKTHKVALGEKNYQADINVASNLGASSSLKNPGLHLIVNSSVQFNSKEFVNIQTLDSLQIIDRDKVYLKLDIQGNELEALIGAEKSIERISAIELEMSYTPQYLGEPESFKIVELLIIRGFRQIYSSIPRVDKFGRQWDFNSIFVKDDVWRKLTNGIEVKENGSI